VLDADQPHVMALERLSQSDIILRSEERMQTWVAQVGVHQKGAPAELSESNRELGCQLCAAFGSAGAQ